jgi:sec-independent protein translocase protein TatA
MELIIVVVIALLVFGPGKLGDLGGALGRGMREFRKNIDGDDTGSTADASSASSATSPTDASSPSSAASSTDAAAGPSDDRSAADFAVCGACGGRNPAAAKFCATCGSAIAA